MSDHLCRLKALYRAKPSMAAIVVPRVTRSQKDVLLMSDPFRCLQTGSDIERDLNTLSISGDLADTHPAKQANFSLASADL